MSRPDFGCACHECVALRHGIKAHHAEPAPVTEGPAQEKAALEAALDDLQAIVRILWAIGGYMTPEQQYALRSAMARLEAHGRTP